MEKQEGYLEQQPVGFVEPATPEAPPRRLIVPAVMSYLEKQSSRWPAHSNRASEIGHPCERYLVYRRVRWQDSILPDARLQAIFRLGDLFEGYVFELLTKSGLVVTEQQVPFHDKQANLGGRLDAIAHWKDDPGHRFPVEVKSAAPHIWDKINTPADFNFKPWLKKYVPQIMSYMLFHRADGYQDGAIILINKSTGLLKEIWFDLDLEYMDVLLEKCRRVNAAVYRYEAEIDGRDDRLPARITDISTCEMCDFRHICRPETDFGSELVISDDPEFDQKLKRMLENKGALAEAAALEKEVKDRLKATAEKAGTNDYKYLTPDALVMGKKDARGAWRWTFTNVGEPAAEGEE